MLALCVRCGQVAFAENCVNPACAATAVDIDLRQVFREWFLGVDTLEELGRAVQEINQHCEDPDLRRSVFLDYVAKRHPWILRLEGEDPVLQARVDEVLRQCSFSMVEKREVVAEQQETLRKSTYDDDDLP